MWNLDAIRLIFFLELVGILSRFCRFMRLIIVYLSIFIVFMPLFNEISFNFLVIMPLNALSASLSY